MALDSRTFRREWRLGERRANDSAQHADKPASRPMPYGLLGLRSWVGLGRVFGTSARRKFSCRAWSLTGAVIGACLATGCHYVDPQCLSPNFGKSARRVHGALLELRLNLPHKSHTHPISLVVDGAGGMEYTETDGAVTTCRRLDQEQREVLSGLWTEAEVGITLPSCTSGYRFQRLDDERRCDRYGRGARPYAWFLYQGVNATLSLHWDLKTPLPEELEQAVTGTPGSLCHESRRLGRNLRRSAPALAARTACADIMSR